IRRKLIRRGPNHPGQVGAKIRAIERKFFATLTVLDDNGAVSSQTNQKLLITVMGVFAANARSRNIEHDENPSRHERQLSSELPDQEVPMDIFEPLQPVWCDTLYRGLICVWE